MARDEAQKDDHLCADEQGVRRDQPQALRVRTNVQAGAWRCNSCAGETMGSQLFKPQCSYCEGF
jgi:hypothetical protein